MDILKCHGCGRVLFEDKHMEMFYHDEKWNWHNICCKCYMIQRNRPSVWHDECMEQFRINKMEKQ